MFLAELSLPIGKSAESDQAMIERVHNTMAQAFPGE
jgi:hypothetical protein